MGVWIETVIRNLLKYRKLSLLMWECGLKLLTHFCRLTITGSLLMWECGLKRGYVSDENRTCRHSLCGSVDWNDTIDENDDLFSCHSLCGSVDWNPSMIRKGGKNLKSLLMWECGLKPEFEQRIYAADRHSLCGSVDWNTIYRTPGRTNKVTPYVGVWIETGTELYSLHRPAVTPYVGVWIETLTIIARYTSLLSLLMWECGLKHEDKHHLDNNQVSLLMWECGLKPPMLGNDAFTNSHSLCGSVDWNIEEDWMWGKNYVTPYVGVWIETKISREGMERMKSLLMWECGLKHSLLGRPGAQT